MGVIPDLNQPVAFRGIALNTVAQVSPTGVPHLLGCTVDSMDVTNVDLAQFTEKLALKHGIDYGGVWWGGRAVSLEGTVYGSTRADAYARINALEAVALPERGTFGMYPLTYYSGGTLKTVTCRPNGLRCAISRDAHGGDEDEPLAIRWSLTFLAASPEIT